MSISPPPSREKLPVNNGWAEMPRAWIKYFTELASQASASAATTWSAISKTGSSLADLETRNHSALQNLNTADNAHLYLADRNNLVSGDDTTLHYHESDRALSNATGVLAIANGGTGQDTAQEAIDALSQVSAATDEYVLTKDTASGNAIWKAAPSAAAISNVISIPTTIAVDTSYIVLGYLTIDDELAINGNLGII